MEMVQPDLHSRLKKALTILFDKTADDKGDEDGDWAQLIVADDSGESGGSGQSEQVGGFGSAVAAILDFPKGSACVRLLLRLVEQHPHAIEQNITTGDISSLIGAMIDLRREVEAWRAPGGSHAMPA